MRISFKKISFNKALRILIFFACLILIADSLPLLFLGTTSEERSPIVVFAFSMIAIYIIIKRILVSRPRRFYKKANLGKTVQMLVDHCLGPAPWYWETFPMITGNLRTKYGWNNHGDRGRYSSLISFSSSGEPQNLKIVLNTYTRAFSVPPHHLGIWLLANKQIQIMCFDPEKMPGFSIENIPVDFRNSRASHYTLANPVAQVAIPATLSEGLHNFWFPPEFHGVEELLVVIPYSGKEASYAIFELHPRSGDIRVMPQKWFTREKFDLNTQWIARVVRDPDSGKIYGDGIRIGIFELSEDDCHLARWVGVS